jgi:hypothetical protein
MLKAKLFSFVATAALHVSYDPYNTSSMAKEIEPIKS